jgi:hypothetical protein
MKVTITIPNRHTSSLAVIDAPTSVRVRTLTTVRPEIAKMAPPIQYSSTRAITLAMRCIRFTPRGSSKSTRIRVVRAQWTEALRRMPPYLRRVRCDVYSA